MKFNNLFNNIGYFPETSTMRDAWIEEYLQKAWILGFYPKGFRAESRYRMEEDVTYRIGRKGPDWDPEEGIHTHETHFVDFKRLPMGDADWADGAHACEESITINKMGDVMNLLVPWLIKNNYTARVYITPGGMRWFITSHAVHPAQAFMRNWFTDLPYDPWYATFCCKADVMRIFEEKGETMFGTFIPYGQRQLFIGSSWAVRISPKKGRENDFIAYPVGVFGNAPENPRLIKLLKIYHDDVIERQWTRKSIAAAKQLIIEKS